jgi:hypothetical protein
MQLHLDDEPCAEDFAPFRDEPFGRRAITRAHERGNRARRGTGERVQSRAAIEQLRARDIRAAAFAPCARFLPRTPRAHARLCDECGEIAKAIGVAREKRHRPAIHTKLGARENAHIVRAPSEHGAHEAAKVCRVGDADGAVAECGGAFDERFGRDAAVAERERGVSAQLDVREFLHRSIPPAVQIPAAGFFLRVAKEPDERAFVRHTAKIFARVGAQTVSLAAR